MSPEHPCVRSGYCCQTSTCSFGEWDDKLHQCRFLIGDEPGNFACGKYDEIVNQPGALMSPAFGQGCCSSLNPVRLRLLRKAS